MSREDSRVPHPSAFCALGWEKTRQAANLDPVVNRSALCFRFFDLQSLKSPPKQRQLELIG